MQAWAWVLAAGLLTALPAAGEGEVEGAPAEPPPASIQEAPETKPTAPLHQLASLLTRGQWEVERPVGGPRPFPVGKRAQCANDPEAHLLGSSDLRLSCDDATQRCQVASSQQLDANGKPTGERLARLGGCDSVDVVRLHARGYRFEEGIADAEPGWVRDARGRAMQVEFDMHRRVLLGAGFAPRLDGFTPDGVAEVGLRSDWATTHTASEVELFRLRLLEARYTPLRGRLLGTAMQLEFDRRRSEPVLWITTFVGTPRRFDVGLDLGWWLQLAHADLELRRGLTAGRLLVAGFDPTLDLLRSQDLDSYLRIRSGVGFDVDVGTKRPQGEVHAALEGEWVIDGAGFHRLYGNAIGTLSRDFVATSAGPRTLRRLEGRAGYELILLAINDQPISALFDLGADWREDLPGRTPGWEFTGQAGLRFSFWAPARRTPDR